MLVIPLPPADEILYFYVLSNKDPDPRIDVAEHFGSMKISNFVTILFLQRLSFVSQFSSIIPARNNIGVDNIMCFCHIIKM